MAIELVAPSRTIDMIGPNLAAKVTCPFCNLENVFRRLEGPVSPVRSIDICEHIRAHVIDDDGERMFEHMLAHSPC